MIISQEQMEIEAARDLTLKSELRCIRMRRCNVELQGEETSLKPPFGLAQSHNTSATLVDNVLRVEVCFSFQGFDASDAKASLFSVQCTFDVDYEIEQNYYPDQGAINAFKDGNAVFNCWPYARETVQDFASRMGISPPPLPLLRMVPKSKEASPNVSLEPIPGMAK
jgi:hypothetical protein